MKTLFAVAVLVFAVSVFGSVGRPVSDLRFDGRAFISEANIASDGANFLLLSSTYESGQRHAFTQKLVDGKPVGPHRQIGFGTPAGLGWTGNGYLAAWQDKQELWVATVSRDGSLTSTPEQPILQGRSTFIAANRNGALAFGYTSGQLVVQRLDFAGRPIGSPVIHPVPVNYEFAPVTAGPAAGGFGVAFAGYDGTWLMLFRADGSPMSGNPILLDGPSNAYSTAEIAVNTNGSETMVVFSRSARDSEAELRSAVIGADGLLKSVRVTYSLPAVAYRTRWIQPVGLVWDGSQYVTAVYVNQGDGANIDPELVRITRDGERVGDPTLLNGEPGQQIPTAVGWNGRNLLVSIHDRQDWPKYDAVCLSVDGAMNVSDGARISRTIASQDELTLEAAGGGYLAAWFEDSTNATTVRASRVDAAGNYLDREGLVLANLPLPPRFSSRSIAIDGSGPYWFIVWASGYRIHGRFVSRRGIPIGAAPLPIDAGDDVAIRWNGSEYAVLRTADGSLYRTAVSGSGAVGETRIIAQYEEPDYDSWIAYEMPALVMLAGRELAVFDKVSGSCGGVAPGCGADATTLGLQLDVPDATPFVIAADAWERAIAAGPTQALMTWRTYNGMRGIFLPAGAPSQLGSSFLIEDQANVTALAFNGNDFIAAWWKDGLATARITSAGAIHDRQHMPLARAELGSKPVIAASATMRPLAGFIGQQSHYDNVARGALVFVDEISEPTAPATPQITCTTRDDDGRITVHWEPVARAQGISIELELEDGTFRPIGVAAGDATTAVAPSPGLNGSAVRLRAWNSAGMSQASGPAPSLPAPQVALTDGVVNACASVPVEVRAILVGTAPFTVQWSDGFVQTGVTESTVSRWLTFTQDAELSIVSVTDASCERGASVGSTRIRIGDTPVIDAQSGTVRVARDHTATLSVVAHTEDVLYAWFEGARGDMSHPVGTYASTFTTPPVTGTRHYWARLTTSCGTLDSAPMTVTLNGRRRAVQP